MAKTFGAEKKIGDVVCIAEWVYVEDFEAFETGYRGDYCEWPWMSFRGEFNSEVR